MSSAGPGADRAMARLMKHMTALIALDKAAIARLQVRLQEMERISRTRSVTIRRDGKGAESMSENATAAPRPDPAHGWITLGYEGDMGVFRYVAGQRTQIPPDQLTDAQIRQIADGNPCFFRQALRKVSEGQNDSGTGAKTMAEFERVAAAYASDERAGRGIYAAFLEGAKFGAMRAANEFIAGARAKEEQARAAAPSSPPSSLASCQGSAEACPSPDNDGWRCIPGCPYAASASPVDPRDTFEVPDGFEEVRDAEGRATGVVIPIGWVEQGKESDDEFEARHPRGLIAGAVARHADREADITLLKKTISAMEARAYESGRKQAFDEMRGTNVLILDDDAFAVGDQVEKFTGDYTAKGEVRGIFAMKNGAIRCIVEHPAEGGGSFCHIYAPKNLRRVEG